MTKGSQTTRLSIINLKREVKNQIYTDTGEWEEIPEVTL